MEQLINYINHYTTLDTDAIVALEKYIEFETYTKNQYILSAEKTCSKVWFIKSGMVRKFHLLDGNEVTTWIHFENEMFTSLNSYISSTPANEFFQACENSSLISITKQNSEKLNQFQQFATFSNKLLGDQLAKIGEGSRKLKSMDAAQKYKFLQTISPQLFKRAKLGHIASIIGITQETLSRIRKQSFIF